MIAGMASEVFTGVDTLLESGGDAGALDYLAQQFEQSGEYHLLFEARLMKKRMELGLPLIQTQDASLLPAETRSAYEQGMVDAAREAGSGYLKAGRIARAWPYFRAIGDNAPVAAALEGPINSEDMDAVISIAMQEGVHPHRGLELVLEHQGMCRAITTFGMFGVQKDREKCIELLTRNLHQEIVERMTRAIEGQEGVLPLSHDLCELMAGRDWLFGEFDYYVDTSHLISLLPYCLEVSDSATLGLFHELCEYGKKLGPNFQTKGQPPFENMYADYGAYVEAARSVDVEGGIAHFRKIADECDTEYVGNGPIHFLIKLLVRFERFDDALDVSVGRLGGDGADDCPSAMQICRMAGNFPRLKELAKMRGDALSYAGASIDERRDRGV